MVGFPYRIPAKEVTMNIAFSILRAIFAPPPGERQRTYIGCFSNDTIDRFYD